MQLPLNDLAYLAIDCQATGNSPKNDHLLEIGWQAFTVTPSSTPHEGQTVLIHLPEGVTLSSRIQKLTGIQACDLKQAVSVGTAVEGLLACARRVAQRNGLPTCPAVIHYARFEMGFLRQAFQDLNISAMPPLDVICTHQIATRLMPELPRKGLRAVAGYLAHSVPTPKRCKGHLEATQWIWRHMVRQLNDQEGITTLDQLRGWLKNSRVPATPRIYPMPASARKTLPDAPGIYRMKRSNGDLLYVGKATYLKQRVNSYFHKGRRHPEHILEMLTQAMDLEVTPTATALEAALLESDAIKHCQPPYNIALSRLHRGLFYVSRDFDRHANKFHSERPLGPVPSVDPFAAAHALARHLLMANEKTYDRATLMAMPMDYCPDSSTIDSGLALFKEKHGHLFLQKPIGQAVIGIGHTSWRQKMEEKLTADDAPPAQKVDDQEDDAFCWTPETVAQALESICRRCGFFLRRARWFRMLSNSRVIWRIRNDETNGLRALMLKQGIVFNALYIPRGSPLPPFPLHQGSNNERNHGIDLATYDRMRVLTTEIRRLTTEDRLSCIGLGRRSYLYPDQVRRLLLWI